MTFSICLCFNLTVLYFRLINRLQIIPKIQSTNVSLNLAHVHLLHLLIYLDYFYHFIYFLLELPVLFLFLTIFISCFFPSTSLEVRLSISMIFMASLGILTWLLYQNLKSTRRSNFTFTSHFHALEKDIATHSSVPAWRITGTAEPGGLPSTGSHRVDTTEAT